MARRSGFAVSRALSYKLLGYVLDKPQSVVYTQLMPSQIKRFGGPSGMCIPQVKTRYEKV